MYVYHSWNLCGIVPGNENPLKFLLVRRYVCSMHTEIVFARRTD